MPIQATISSNLTIMGSQFLSNLQDKGNGRGEFLLNLVEGFIITNLRGKLGLSEILLSSLLLPSVMLWKKGVEKLTK